MTAYELIIPIIMRQIFDLRWKMPAYNAANFQFYLGQDEGLVKLLREIVKAGEQEYKTREIVMGVLGHCWGGDVDVIYNQLLGSDYARE